MKIDRLLGIVVYLLGRDTVSARVLAEKFGVSPRTIQRDIESISLAGIPVGSLQGQSGGYFIVDSFKMNRQLLQAEDYAIILAALKGLLSGYDNERAQNAVDKMMALSPDRALPQQAFQLNLGVLREGKNTAQDMAVLEQAIKEKKVIRFQYTDARNIVSDRCVEPLLLTYKWYAWYLFAYCRDKQDYRLFRISRMRQAASMSKPFAATHADAEDLLAAHTDHRHSINVKLLCAAEGRVLLEEAFPNAELLDVREVGLVMSFSVPEEESGWFGRLLEHSDLVTVLEPESLRERMRSLAERMVKKYG
ncbi:helix-turn-helix transcriptional regulator [Paenibacillus sp. HW567]|uniref:helix-turn-helix transcriptional regulator n=1 Tax=Paenibacillus sp. HW567 TaxID=1034769 RepID=UPI000375309C|nr:YafY family protein [Paenibacillus sp. HW567]